jgi:hypothetical protein
MRKKYTFRLVGFGKYERIETEIKGPRPAGFYWVKYNGNNDWIIAEWTGEIWFCINDSASLKDFNFDMIYEYPIEPPSI